MKNLYLFFVLLFGAQMTHAQLIYFEDFEGIGAGNVSVINTVTGGPMTTYDVDGLTPNAAVSQFTDAWIAMDDFDFPGDTVGASTSWYTPAGQSDDWMVTPQIAIPAGGGSLSWDAEAQDPAYPDGYEVWVSTTTNTTAALLAGTMVFSVANEANPWTSHTVNLNAFANSNIYIGFRNNSTDQFILLIDDIAVNGPNIPDDAAINSVSGSEFTVATLNSTRGCPAELGANVSNEGINATNVFLKCNIYKDTTYLTTLYSDTVASLAQGADTNLTFPDSFLFVSEDFFIFEYVVCMDENDTITANDTAYAALLLDNTFMARDDNTVTGSLGIGPGTPGILGQNFTLKKPNRMLSALGYLVNPEPGDTTSFSLYSTDSTGMPDTLIAQTPIHTISPADSAAFLALDFPAPLDLPAGTYCLAINEEDANITIGTTPNIFTPGTTWVTFPGAPVLPWGNNEDYNFLVSYLLRPVFEPCLDELHLASVIPGYEFDIKYEVDSLITSTDYIEAGATNILYDAGFNIDLLPGFFVELGAEFEAVIDGCGGLRKLATKRKIFNGVNKSVVREKGHKSFVRQTRR